MAVLALIRALGYLSGDLVALISLGLLVAAGLVWLELAQERRPPLHWRTLSPSDGFSGAAFPLFCAYSWHDTFVNALNGWALTITVVAATLVFCFVALEFVLRVPQRVIDYRQVLFGPMTEKHRRFDYYARRHELFCLAGEDQARKARIRRRALRAAKRRKAAREKVWLSKFDQNVLVPYTDTSMWLAAYTISASVFALLVQHAQPGPLTAQLLFVPMALIPPFSYVWRRVTASARAV
ncbi:hypothetical protein [Amycolatopsis sp. NPDC003676]